MSVFRSILISQASQTGGTYYAYKDSSNNIIYTKGELANQGTFTLQNASTVGNPVENNGIYSSFSANNYILFSLPTLTTSGKIIIKAIYNNNSNQQYIINAKEDNKCLLVYQQHLRYWDGNDGISGSTTLTNGTYWIGLELFPSSLNAYLLADNNYTLETLPDFSSTWTQEFTFNSNVFQYLDFMFSRTYNTTSYYWLGSFDMYQTEYVFDGVTTRFGTITGASTLYDNTFTAIANSRFYLDSGNVVYNGTTYTRSSADDVTI